MATTTPKSANVAAARSMDVAELLETMLLNLPLNEILLNQRVCRTWKNVIENSPSLQKALFFRPCTSFQLSLVEDRGVYGANCRDIEHCQSQHHYYEREMRGDVRWAREATDSTEYRILVNPFLGVNGPEWKRYINKKGLFMRLKAGKRPEASWRKMLFTQPPLSEALVDHGGLYHWHDITIEGRARGITLNDMVQSGERFYRSIWAVWGEDGFARIPVLEDGGKPAKCTANTLLAEMAKEPAEDQYDWTRA